MWLQPRPAPKAADELQPASLPSIEGPIVHIAFPCHPSSGHCRRSHSVRWWCYVCVHVCANPVASTQAMTTAIYSTYSTAPDDEEWAVLQLRGRRPRHAAGGRVDSVQGVPHARTLRATSSPSATTTHACGASRPASPRRTPPRWRRDWWHSDTSSLSTGGAVSILASMAKASASTPPPRSRRRHAAAARDGGRSRRRRRRRRPRP